jgi:hypothetical protein
MLWNPKVGYGTLRWDQGVLELWGALPNELKKVG